MPLLDSQKHVASLDGHTGSVESLAVSPLTHNILVSGDLDGILNIWDLKNFKLRYTCQHPEGITQVRFLKDSHLVATTSVDGILRIIDSRSGIITKDFKGHLDAILDLACQSSSCMVTASDDGSCLVFSKAE